MKKKKVIKEKVSFKDTAKSHTINCKCCSNPTKCSASAAWVICWECVVHNRMGLSDKPKPKEKKSKSKTKVKSKLKRKK